METVLWSLRWLPSLCNISASMARSCRVVDGSTHYIDFLKVCMEPCFKKMLKVPRKRWIYIHIYNTKPHNYKGYFQTDATFSYYKQCVLPSIVYDPVFFTNRLQRTSQFSKKGNTVFLVYDALCSWVVNHPWSNGGFFYKGGPGSIPVRGHIFFISISRVFRQQTLIYTVKKGDHLF